MVFIWRGFGLIVPIVFGICAWIVSYWYDDTRLGNASFMGWSCFYASIVLLLPGLGLWGSKDEEDGSKRHHDFMFIPVLFWSLLLGGLCAYLLLTRDPAPEENTNTTEQVEEKDDKEVNYRTVNFINSSLDTLEMVISIDKGEVDRFTVDPKSWLPRDLEPHAYTFTVYDRSGKVLENFPMKATVDEPTESALDYDAAWIQMDGAERALIVIDVTEMIPDGYSTTDMKKKDDWIKNVVDHCDPKKMIEPSIPYETGPYPTILEPGDLLPSAAKVKGKVYALITVDLHTPMTNEFITDRLTELYFE